MMPRSGGSSRSMPQAGSHIATFLCCSWHCLRLSCCESYGRCRLTGAPHGLDDSCKHSKAISSNVLQDKLSKSVEKVCGYNTRGLRSILEELLLDTMYDLPSRTDVRECTVTEDDVHAVTERQQPVLLYKHAS